MSAPAAATAPNDVPQPTPSPSATSIAQSLYRDALHCVFQMLSLSELIPAAQTSKEWWSAACKERPRAVALQLRPNQLPAVCAARLRKHISSVFVRESLSNAELHLLHALPSLTELQAPINFAALSAGAANDDAANGGSVLPPQLCSLVVTGASTLGAVDISALLLLPRLSSLHCPSATTPAQCAVLKSLPALKRLQTDSGKWSQALLDSLCSPPHALQHLQELSLHGTAIDQDIMRSLVRLQSLTTLEPKSLDPPCWPSIARFPQLRMLLLRSIGTTSAEQQQQLFTALARCRQLVDVSLSHDNLADAPALVSQWWSSLAQSLPQLTRLRVYSMRMPSLQYLAGLPLLATLEMVDCSGIFAVDLSTLGGARLPLLRRLHVQECGDLTPEQQQQLQGPTELHPRVQDFVFRK